MLAESQEDRVQRLELAVSSVLNHSVDSSFTSLINKNHHLFKGFKLIYSTDNTELSFGYTSLKYIESQCSVINKFFFGTGLYFYSDNIQEKIFKNNIVEVSLDYSLSLDSNVAEKFRVWENGGSLDREVDRFEELVRFIKKGFNFDYSFFIIENLLDSKNKNNHRPFHTVKALKRFDHLVYDSESFDIYNPKFSESREESSKRAIETLYLYQSNSEFEGFLRRRKGAYLILLKAIMIRDVANLDLNKKLELLIEFSLNSLGAFAKTEIYYGWKLLKYGKQLRFFDPISQIGLKSLNKIRGMSWDLFSIRYQETMASETKFGDFYIPFFASFDNKFVELSKVCPIRALIIDDRDKRVISVHLDELEFINDIENSIQEKLSKKLHNPAEKVRRMAQRKSSKDLDVEISNLEREFNSICKDNF